MRNPIVTLFAALLAGGFVLGTDNSRGKLVEAPAAHPTLVNPPCSHCKDEAKRRRGELRVDDRVLCWTRGKYDGGAIPFRFFLHKHRVISDTYGVFVLDADAGYARAFAPSLQFTFHGWRDGVMVMKHKDGTLYSCLSGVAFAGPRKGDRLKTVPTVVSDWGWWVKEYPDTVAFRMFDKHKAVDLSAKANADSLRSRGKPDARLKADERVLGVRVGKAAKAFRLAELKEKGLIVSRVGDRDCAAVYFAPTQTAAAYAPTASPPDGKGKPIAVRLAVDDRTPDAPFADALSGTRFDVTGRGVSGKLKGYTLEWLDGVDVRWFAWAAEYPETTIHGR